jgi:hypothetical protein
MSPFVTCAKCNTMTFIDAARARSFAAVLDGNVAPSAAAALEPEALPKCQTCGSTEDFWMGSHNLLSLLGSNRAELERQILKEKVAATKIQGAYRNYLRGRWARAEVAQRLVVAMLLYRAATLIAALVRGRLGRRRQLTFTALEIVKGAHAKLLKEAVRGDKKIHKRRCFWYRRDQVAVLFKDYLIVAERTGFDPPRTRTLIEVPPTTPIAKKKMLTACVAHKQTNKQTNKRTNEPVVELNILEIARRIRVREAYLATCIQSRFRGMQARRFLLIFHREVVRVREIRFAAAQRVRHALMAILDQQPITNTPDTHE